MENFRNELEKIETNDSFMFTELETLKEVYREANKSQTEKQLNKLINEMFNISDIFSEVNENSSNQDIIDLFDGKWMSEKITIAQIFLKNEGFYKGKIDGKAGKMFFKGIKQRIIQSDKNDTELDVNTDKNIEKVQETNRIFNDVKLDVFVQFSKLKKGIWKKSELLNELNKLEELISGEKGFDKNLLSEDDKEILYALHKILENKSIEVGAIEKNKDETKKESEEVEKKEKNESYVKFEGAEKVYEIENSRELDKKIRDYLYLSQIGKLEGIKEFLEEYEGFFMPRDDGKKEKNHKYLRQREKYQDIWTNYNNKVKDKDLKHSIPIDILSASTYKKSTMCSKTVRLTMEGLGLKVARGNADSIDSKYRRNNFDTSSRGSFSINNLKWADGQIYDLVGGNHRLIAFKHPNTGELMAIDPYYGDKNLYFHNSKAFPLENYSKLNKIKTFYGFNIDNDKLLNLV